MTQYQAGKRYVRRDGKISGPIRQYPEEAHYAFFDAPPEGGRINYRADGSHAFSGLAHGFDLLSEYVEPVKPDPFTMNGPQGGIGSMTLEYKLAPPAGEGRKDDTGKEPFDLIAPEFLFATARVLGYGAKKYAPRNWERGMAWSRVFAALMRHMWAWWGGAGPTTKSFLFGEIDDETKFSHLWHASCCLMFLTAYEERGSGIDDRWRAPDGK